MKESWLWGARCISLTERSAVSPTTGEEPIQWSLFTMAAWELSLKAIVDLRSWQTPHGSSQDPRGGPDKWQTATKMLRKERRTINSTIMRGWGVSSKQRAVSLSKSEMIFHSWPRQLNATILMSYTLLIQSKFRFQFGFQIGVGIDWIDSFEVVPQIRADFETQGLHD